MSSTEQVHEGMQVYTTDDRSIGTIERVEGNTIKVAGKSYPVSAVDQIVKNRVYLKVSGLADGSAGQDTSMNTDDSIRVPVMEERLSVDRRQADLGDVEIRKTVDEEQVAVPVELRREEVHVQQVDTDDRPLSASEMGDAFKEGTIRVPVRGEEAVVSKQAYVTGEVVVDKSQVVERQEVRDTVRRERVDVAENFNRDRANFQRHFQRQGLKGTYEEAEPHYRMGYLAGADERYAGRQFDEIEADLRMDYEATHAGDRDGWSRLRAAVREGFTRARDK